MEGTSGTTSTSVQTQAQQGQDGFKAQQQNQFSKKTTSTPPVKNSRGTDVNPLKSQTSDVEREVAQSFQNPREEGDSPDENQDPETNPEEAKEGRKWKLKISGKEHEVTEDQLLKLASQGGRMYQAMEEAATYRKQTEQFSQVFDRITKDPEAFFELGKMLGHDVDALTHNRVVKKLQYDLMDEKDRKLYDLERENAKYRETNEQQVARQHEERRQQAQLKATETSQNEVVDFFNSRGGQRDPYEIANTLEVKLEAMAAGRDIPIAKAYEIAQSRSQKLLERKLESLSDEDIRRLPPAKKEQIRKFFISEVKGNNNYNSSQSAPAERKQNQRPEIQSKKSMTIDEFYEDFIPKRLKN